MHTFITHIIHITHTRYTCVPHTYIMHESLREWHVSRGYITYTNHTHHTHHRNLTCILCTHVSCMYHMQITHRCMSHTRTHSAMHRANILIIGSTTLCRGRMAWFSVKSCHGNLEGLGIKIPPRVFESWHACCPCQLTDVLSWPVSVGDP